MAFVANVDEATLAHYYEENIILDEGGRIVLDSGSTHTIDGIIHTEACGWLSFITAIRFLIFVKKCAYDVVDDFSAGMYNLDLLKQIANITTTGVGLRV